MERQGGGLRTIKIVISVVVFSLGLIAYQSCGPSGFQTKSFSSFTGDSSLNGQLESKSFDEKEFLNSIGKNEIDLNDYFFNGQMNKTINQCQQLNAQGSSLSKKYLGIGKSGTLYGFVVDPCSSESPQVQIEIFNNATNAAEVKAAEIIPIYFDMTTQKIFYLYRYNLAKNYLAGSFLPEAQKERINFDFTLGNDPPPELPPRILKSLKSISMTQGQELKEGDFCIIVSGSNLSYRWEKNGQGTSANRECYSVASVKDSDAGDYKVYVKNDLGEITVTAKIELNVPPVIVSPLKSIGRLAQSAVKDDEFCVEARGTGTLTYEWFLNGNKAPFSSDKRCYLIASAILTDSGTYEVRVSNSFGQAKSSANINVGLESPKIIKGLSNITVDEKAGLSSEQFCVTATGQNVTYAWVKDGVAAPYNSNNRCYLIPSAKISDQGNYIVTVANSGGATTSQAFLAVRSLTLSRTNSTAVSVGYKQSVDLTVSMPEAPNGRELDIVVDLAYSSAGCSEQLFKYCPGFTVDVYPPAGTLAGARNSSYESLYCSNSFSNNPADANGTLTTLLSSKVQNCGGPYVYPLLKAGKVAGEWTLRFTGGVNTSLIIKSWTLTFK